MNPMAVDLARLSLWLVTLARDHEFTFLDHALKAGDSLVGLTRSEIAAAHWDSSKPGAAAIPRHDPASGGARTRRPRGDPQRERRRSDRGAGGALLARFGCERAGADRGRCCDRRVLLRGQAARARDGAAEGRKLDRRVAELGLGSAAHRGRRVPGRTRLAAVSLGDRVSGGICEGESRVRHGCRQPAVPRQEHDFRLLRQTLFTMAPNAA